MICQRRFEGLRVGECVMIASLPLDVLRLFAVVREVEMVKVVI